MTGETQVTPITERFAMKKIVFAYDGSDGATAALGELCRETIAPELEVKVLGVVEVWVPPNGRLHLENEALWPESIRAARQRALQAVRTQGEAVEYASEQLRLAHPTWSITPIIALGPPAPIIVNTANVWGADLIVLGFQRRTLLQRLLFRSVSRTVLQQAPCSVQITHAPTQAPLAKASTAPPAGAFPSPKRRSALAGMGI